MQILIDNYFNSITRLFFTFKYACDGMKIKLNESKWAPLGKINFLAKSFLTFDVNATHIDEQANPVNYNFKGEVFYISFIAEFSISASLLVMKWGIKNWTVLYYNTYYTSTSYLLHSLEIDRVES